MAVNNDAVIHAVEDPICSTDNVWRDSDMSHCLSDDLDAIEQNIANLQTAVGNKAAADHTHDGYATTGHTHSGYAASNHSHSQYAGVDHEHTGYAPESHTHDYAPTSHTHNYAATNHTHTPASIGAAATSHSHAQADISGLADALAGKANASAMTAKADLIDGKVPASQLPSFVDDVLEYAAVSNFPATGETGKIYVATGANKSYRWSGSDYVEVGGGVALGETSSTAYRGDRGKVAYDHSQNANVHVTAAQKTAWDGKAAGDHTHTPASIGAADASHTHTVDSALSSTSTNPVQNKVINTALAGKAASSHTHAQSQVTGLAESLAGKAAASHTHAQSEVDGLASALSGKAASNHTHTASDVGAAAANHTHTPAAIGAAAASHTHDYAASEHTHTPASIGAAAASHTHNYAASGHNHDSAYMAKDLQFTNDIGGVEFSYGSNSGKNLETEILSWPQGFHTAYSITGTPGNPPGSSGESWRIIAHKTSGTIGWILAFGSSGSIFSNYQNSATTFRGWKCIYDATNNMILWSGESYLNSSNGNPQTVTPSKPLSQCRTGWLLLWSDYDPGVGSNDSDFCTTFIPKYTPSGGTWGGKAFYCDICLFVGGDADDLGTEKRCIKPVYVHDNKLVGSHQNTSGGRNDAVLRAVYEI